MTYSFTNKHELAIIILAQKKQSLLHPFQALPLYYLRGGLQNEKMGTVSQVCSNDYLSWNDSYDFTFNCNFKQYDERI